MKNIVGDENPIITGIYKMEDKGFEPVLDVMDAENKVPAQPDQKAVKPLQFQADTNESNDNIKERFDKFDTLSKHSKSTISHQNYAVFRTKNRDAIKALPADLQTVVDSWDVLPDAIRAGIVAMIKLLKK